MSSTEYVKAMLTKNQFLAIPFYRKSPEKIIVRNLEKLPCEGFLNIFPMKIQETKWIPIHLVMLYYNASVRNYSYFLLKKTSPSYRKYKTFTPYLNIFTGSSYNPFFYNLCETTNSKYHITKGSILDKNEKPLIQVLVEVKRISENELEVTDSKVLIDYSVFNAQDNAEKTIKNLLLPTFLENKYKVEFCELSNFDFFEHPIVPTCIEKSRDLVYEVLSKNFDMLDDLIL